jgi:hypothetical protein
VVKIANNQGPQCIGSNGNEKWAGMFNKDERRFNDFRKKGTVETKWESAHFNGGVF